VGDLERGFTAPERPSPWRCSAGGQAVWGWRAGDVARDLARGVEARAGGGGARELAAGSGRELVGSKRERRGEEERCAGLGI
jgi:hypothetical protein